MFLKRFLSEIRNVAIIAHVDHGKTSLIDQILRQSGLAVMPQQRVLDNNELERERGITILSKNTSIDYNGIKINIIDTPGHADFGGEVERVLSMVNGVVLVCCATEGPMTQTKFVLKKALSRNLNALVVLNKVDRPTANPSKVENDLLELFCQLNASDTQLDYPVLYSSAKEGWASLNPEKKGDSMTPLLDALVDYIPPPKGNTEMPFSLLITVKLFKSAN
jgi:GTP-binding protein